MPGGGAMPDSLTPFHRRTRTAKRELRRSLTLKTAAEHIGHLSPGIELFGVTKSFSLIDAIEHLLNEAGPSHVTLATWSAANADLAHAHKLLTNGAILSFRLVTDFSFQARQPAYCAGLRQRFGDASVRVTKCHLKCCILRNDQWNLTLRTSANLNENLRLESYELSDDRDLADYFEQIVTDLFAFQQPGEGFEKRPGDLCKDFARFGEQGAPADPAAIVQSADEAKYCGKGRFDRDINRRGLSYAR